MSRSLATALALALSALPARAAAGGDDDKGGVLLGVGYGLHRYFNSGLSVQTYDQTRLFDGYYLQAHAGYQFRWGGLLALDFAYYDGSNAVAMPDGSQLKLSLRTETLSLLLGGEWGPGRWIRFHVGVLAGAAFGSFQRTFTLGSATDAHSSMVIRPALGTQLGLDVRPLTWLSIGLRVRAGLTFRTSADPDSADLGGLFAGLNLAVVI
jgi:hypothetical protein